MDPSSALSLLTLPCATVQWMSLMPLAPNVFVLRAQAPDPFQLVGSHQALLISLCIDCVSVFDFESC